ncbi:hypothetical protein N7540_009972 [Penicillium herquei]|nr:hypothetical protein N7540_009972 [Penicillium herquei]
MAAGPNRSRLSKWYPISFAIAAVVFFIIGGALVGTYYNSTWSSCDSSYYYYDSYYSDSSCFDDGNSGEFYGGIACIVIGGILKLTAWILFIIWCVKRQRGNSTTITYVNNAPMEPIKQQQPYAAPQPMYPAQHGAPYVPPSPASPGPIYAEAGAHSSVGTPPPKEGLATGTGYKFCSQCGIASSGRFCPQCGIAV